MGEEIMEVLFFWDEFWYVSIKLCGRNKFCERVYMSVARLIVGFRGEEFCGWWVLGKVNFISFEEKVCMML